MLSAGELACMYDTIKSSLDQSLTLTRNTYTTESGRQKISGSATNTIACNVIKPTASQLQEYASKIGSARSLVLRAMQDTDIREGDYVAYDGLNWKINGALNAASYSVTKKYLMVVVA